MSGQDPQAPGGGYGPPSGQDPYPQQPYAQQPSTQQGGPDQYGQAPGQGGYAQQGGPRKTNTMAILALVFAFVIAPLGVVFGFVARSQIRRNGESGSGLALAGIIIGLLAIVGYIVLTIGLVAAARHGITGLPTPSPSF